MQLNESDESPAEVKNFMVATGSETTLPWRRHRDGRAADRQLTGALLLQQVPEKMGIIGLEMGSV